MGCSPGGVGEGQVDGSGGEAIEGGDRLVIGEFKARDGERGGDGGIIVVGRAHLPNSLEHILRREEEGRGDEKGWGRGGEWSWSHRGDERVVGIGDCLRSSHSRQWHSEGHPLGIQENIRQSPHQSLGHYHQRAQRLSSHCCPGVVVWFQ